MYLIKHFWVWLCEGKMALQEFFKNSTEEKLDKMSEDVKFGS